LAAVALRGAPIVATPKVEHIEISATIDDQVLPTTKRSTHCCAIARRQLAPIERLEIPLPPLPPQEAALQLKL